MTGVRFADVQGRPAEFLNLTSLTLEEFEVLVIPFEAAFQAHMAAWRLDGKPRTGLGQFRRQIAATAVWSGLCWGVLLDEIGEPGHTVGLGYFQPGAEVIPE
jgi:hypothetical protein